MATYKQIQQYVKATNGFTPKTCWIAHVRSDHGMTTRQAANRYAANRRAHPCPPEKRQAIEDALRVLGAFDT
ncbi:hypothetical protein VQ045_10120 [Aurantimonas sp. E1-2-R+4]|uniref:hypothetical protein n=1 Tax=Aurantimonas sp. E1-2-R+4 TaxID=3113714 RepID=UPI002F91D96A